MLRRVLTSGEVTPQPKAGVNLYTMSGASAKVRNAFTRAEADAIMRTLPELPKIAKQRHNRM